MTITQNCYQELKQVPPWMMGLPSIVLITLNPYQGLKPSCDRVDIPCAPTVWCIQLKTALQSYSFGNGVG